MLPRAPRHSARAAAFTSTAVHLCHSGCCLRATSPTWDGALPRTACHMCASRCSVPRELHQACFVSCPGIRADLLQHNMIELAAAHHTKYIGHQLGLAAIDFHPLHHSQVGQHHSQAGPSYPPPPAPQTHRCSAAHSAYSSTCITSITTLHVVELCILSEPIDNQAG
jgi:hypothetical protein